MLFCVLKRTYRTQIDCQKNELAKKEIRNIEQSTRLKLHIKKKTLVFYDFFLKLIKSLLEKRIFKKIIIKLHELLRTHCQKSENL